MSKPYEYPGGFLLTKKKAEALAVRELGTAKGLEQESGMFKGCFFMELGKMIVRILPDVYTNRGKIAMKIEFSFSTGRIYRFFDPHTLEEDYDLESWFHKVGLREELKDWVDNAGAEHCHKEIDMIANRRL